MMSYQYKFQDDDQTKIKGSVKYVETHTKDSYELHLLGYPTKIGSLYRSGFFGTVVEYGAETKISRHSVLGASVSVGVPQGVTLKIK